MLKIRVTEQDIENGQKGSCRKCPVALALRKHYPDNDLLVGAHDVDIYLDGVAFSSNNLVTYKFPSEVTQFIGDFDDGKPVSPIEFVIDDGISSAIPDEG